MARECTWGCHVVGMVLVKPRGSNPIQTWQVLGGQGGWDLKDEGVVSW